MSNENHELSSIPPCLSCKNPTTLSKKTGKPNKFCSTRCVKHGELHTIKCVQCQKEFEGHRETTCSKECQTKARTNNKPQIIQCSWCQKEISRQPTAIRKNNFCSQECSHLFLRGGQDKFVKKECKNCKKQFEIKYIDREQEFCSNLCAHSGEYSSFYGKPGMMLGKLAWNHGLTKETDERLANLGKKITETAKAQFASGERSITGEKNPNFGKTVADRTPEQLENYSKAAIQRTLNNKIPPGKNAKTGYYVSKKSGCSMFYRSSLEQRVMKILDEQDNVQKYDHEPFSIQVRIGKRYLPDFLVYYKDNTKSIIEVKPKFQLVDEDVILKQKAGEQYCAERGWTYQFYTLEDIIEHEKILRIST